ncbi:MAG: aminoacyl-tRNA hydrolase [Verrucomicrobiota bacterium]
MDAARHSFRLLVGLGNPGREYERTRHNVGFMVLDRIAARTGADWRLVKDWQAQVAGHEGVQFCKPVSYMNLSGKPAGAVARFYKVEPAEMLVVYDDLALPLGKLRFRPNGSAGGHNGMQSIIDHLGSQAIPRLRIGIGSASGGMVNHVLGRFSADELPVLEETLDRAVDAIGFAQTQGLQAAMNQFN